MRSDLTTALLLPFVGALLAGCITPAAAVRPAEPPVLSVAEIAERIPPKVASRSAWATDVAAALDAHGIRRELPAVCSVLAVIEQESGFSADPQVAGLAKLVRQKLQSLTAKLGPLGPPLVEKLLEGRAVGHDDTFAARLDKVRTERDLDRIYRDLLATWEREHPVAFAAADLAGSVATARSLADRNPITTAGSMQVSVAWAMEQQAAKASGRPLTDAELREELYTRRGGVFWGSARLLGYAAAYERPTFRFADYNAGLYASRNAAFQAQLAKLIDPTLVPDGDLLAYDASGEPKDDSATLRALERFRQCFVPSGLSAEQLRSDVLLEKRSEFERTRTWGAVRASYAAQFKESPAYAQVPTVVIRSAKLSGDRSTAWYAQNVERRYDACRSRTSSPAAPEHR